MKTTAILSSTVIASLWTVATAESQIHRDTIFGCTDVGCPPETSVSVTEDNCTVGDESHTYVGLTAVPAQVDALRDGRLTWVKGVQADQKPNPDIFRETFYLGAAPGLEGLGGMGACAVFFNGPYNASLLKFNNSRERELDEGTCADAMGEPCVHALRERALSLSFAPGAASNETCRRLQEDLLTSDIPECSRWTENKWGNISAVEANLVDCAVSRTVALTGNGAPKPITGERNASSNCWPILNKEDSLTPVFQWVNRTNGIPTSYLGITPILTLFWPTYGTALDRRDAALTCVKMMGPANASLATMKSGGGDEGEGGVSTAWSTLTLNAAIGTAVAFALFNTL
ncbi:uncharacterized protein PG986_002727 [Apiospora aurea]|uniref:Uncharacterized protein n=1 Tax=Apiospora aurea TaxID=335848 RepID=A0ABR1QQJ1_9PEZI